MASTGAQRFYAGGGHKSGHSSSVSGSAATSVPVVTVTARRPRLALLATLMATDKLVELATAIVPTVIPVPKFTCVVA